MGLSSSRFVWDPAQVWDLAQSACSIDRSLRMDDGVGTPAFDVAFPLASAIYWIWESCVKYGCGARTNEERALAVQSSILSPCACGVRYNEMMTIVCVMLSYSM